MITVCLFGISAGLEVHPFAVGEPSGVKIDDAWLEISPHDVTVKLDADLFKVYRRLVSGKLLTWIGLYRSATELGSSRPGGYYGAGVWLHDVALPGRSIVEILLNLADQLKVLAVSNGKFVKRIADVRASIVPPQQLSGLTALRGSVGSGVSVNGMIQGFIADPRSVAAIIDWAQRSRTAELFSQIVVGSADQYVQQQGQFQKISEKYESLHAAIDGAYAKRIALVEDVRKKLATDLEATKKEAAQLKQSKESDQKKLQEATQKVSALTAKVDSLQRTARPIDVRPNPRPLDPRPSQFKDEDEEPQKNYDGRLFAIVIAMCVCVLLLVGGLILQRNDIDSLRSVNKGYELDLSRLNERLVTSDQRVIALQGENEKLKQKLASNQLDLANKPSEDHTGGDLLAELQATCVKSDFVKMRFMFILNTPSKSSAANRLPPDPKSIFQEIKKTCQITNQEPNCEAAIEKLGRSFVKNWTPKTTAGDIFMPSSCVKKPFIQDAGQTYRLQLSQVHESSAAKTAGTKDGAVVVQDGRPPSE
jgi:septal ring factor EnvC (AmiA/AmiB activator)